MEGRTQWRVVLLFEALELIFLPFPNCYPPLPFTKTIRISNLVTTLGLFLYSIFYLSVESGGYGGYGRYGGGSHQLVS